VYLVRHGETEWNATDRCQGLADIPMHSAGGAQVAALATQLQSVRFDAAYTSPLDRARQTARILLEYSDVQPTELAELSELSYGNWQGLSPAEWPGNAGAMWKTDPWSMTFPAGESLAMVRERVSSVLAGIVASHPGKTVLVSAHGHVNRILLLDALSLDPDLFWDIVQPNCATYAIEYGRDGTVHQIVSGTTPLADLSSLSLTRSV
jgi:broad specificity phosphatase PhoE